MGTSRLPRRFLFAALVLSLGGMPAAQVPARADLLTVHDPNDSQSRIDIKRVRQGHYFARVLYRVTAYRSWDASDLETGRMVFYFDNDQDPDLERRAILRYHGGGGLQLNLEVVNRNGDKIGGGSVRRPNGRSVEIWISRKLIARSTYEMFVTVTTRSHGACADGCKDRAPQTGMITHQLHKLCSNQEPTITGTEAGETFHGTRNKDVIAPRGGDDRVTRIRANDVVCGGAGDDEIVGKGYVFLKGGPGDDHIRVVGPRIKPCDDSTVCAYPEALAFGGPGRDVLEGGRYRERLKGEKGKDILRGRRGSDRLNGGGGNDTLHGGAGLDVCYAGEELHSCRTY